MRAFLPPAAALVLALTLGAASTSLVAGCAPADDDDRPAYGLFRVELEIDPTDLGQMHSDLFAKVRKGASVRLTDGTGVRRTGRAEVRYSGQYTILSPKKSMDIKLEKPLDYRKARRVRVLSQPTDDTAMRNAMGYEIFASMGFPVPKQEPAFLYVNGMPRGLYLLTEALTPAFLEDRKIPYRSLYQGKFGSADFTISTPAELEEPFQPEHDGGGNVDLARFLGELARAGTIEEIRALSRFLDVDGFLRYFATATFLQHWDGQTNNFYLYRESTSERFKIIPWDMDKIWQGPLPNQSAASRAARGSSAEGRGYDFFAENALSKKLYRVPEWREAYLRHLATLRARYPIARIESMLRSKEARVGAAWRADRISEEYGGTLSRHVDDLVAHVRAWLDATANLTKDVAPHGP